ncbi:MAG: hypothetical protein VKN60_04085 [Cyanobacteriota bacterium]|nr:hypothetical protein [Cyanobacteriota bacterium]
MILPKQTLLWVGLALILGGGAAVVELRRSDNPETSSNAAVREPYFDFAPDQVQSVALRQGEREQRIYRLAEVKAQKSPWRSDLPQVNTPVSQPAVEFLLNVLLESAGERDFTVTKERLGEYGLAPPQGGISLRLVNGKTHRLILGNPDFKGDSLYALVDPPDPLPEEITIRLAPRSLEELIRRSPQDWQTVPEPMASP